MKIDPADLEISGELEELREDLSALLEEKNLGLVQQLVASHTASLSLPELVARNRDTPEGKLQDRINNLCSRDRPLVIEIEPGVQVPSGYPQVYFAASERAVDLLKQISLYEGCYRLMRLYEAAQLELPEDWEQGVSVEDIEDYEHRPIPEWAK